MGYENNTRAGLITRSLAEMTRIGVAYGGNPLTFLSLAGTLLLANRDWKKANLTCTRFFC